MKSLHRHGARLALAVSTLLFAALPMASAAATAFSKIVVFGDSINDYSNMVQFTGGVFPNAPSYVYGRQSNGPTWVEYLAGRLGMSDKLFNYAVVGAMTRPAPGFPTGNVWSDTFPGLEGTDVHSQVLDYLIDSGGAADPDALHILEGGSNDFPRVADPAVIVSNLVQSFLALQQSGAKHIIVTNLPDLGKVPRVILGEQGGLLPPGTGLLVSAATAQLNQALATAIAAVTAGDVSVTFADLHGFLNAVATRPADYGFTQVQLPYLVFGAGSNPATWLFWDDLHPTTRGHQVFAEHVITALVGTYSPRKGNGNGAGVVNSLRGLVGAPGKG